MSSVLGLEMEMENSKEKFIMMKDQRQKMIMRGKRTKRSRPSVVSSSSSSGCSSGGKGENDHVCFSIPSPTSSDQNSACTEEDEDMANCLILLAQSGGDNSVKQETEEIKAEKSSSSRKFTETATTTTAAKAGFYVYECKTCNRSFTSFQALGGHRASHKKPKAMVEEKKVVVPSNPEGQINEAERENVQFNKTGTSFSVHKSSQHNNIIKSKVHECSICGSEFSSGQALGGHMRRHRSIPTTNNNIIDRENEKPRNILQLDLNLPAPEDDHRDSKFPFIFTAPALVGCHY